jgi:hypothetical protein
VDNNPKTNSMGDARMMKSPESNLVSAGPILDAGNSGGIAGSLLHMRPLGPSGPTGSFEAGHRKNRSDNAMARANTNSPKHRPTGISLIASAARRRATHACDFTEKDADNGLRRHDEGVHGSASNGRAQ